MEQAQNTFTGGLQMDTHPMLQKSDSLTDALNATILTMDGNEIVLLNDMGNARIEKVLLPEGYIPVGSKEYGGIVYIASYNPITNLSQIGSFPSPRVENGSWNDEDLSIELGGSILSKFINSGTIKDSTSILHLFESKNSILRAGDKYLLLSEKNFDLSLIDLNNDKSNWITLYVGVLNSQNEFVDITNKMLRFKVLRNKDDIKELSDLLESSNELLPSGYTDKGETYFLSEGSNLLNQSNNEVKYSVNLDEIRKIKELNTYSEKLIGPLCIKEELNIPENIIYYLDAKKGLDDSNEVIVTLTPRLTFEGGDILKDNVGFDFNITPVPTTRWITQTYPSKKIIDNNQVVSCDIGNLPETGVITLEITPFVEINNTPYKLPDRYKIVDKIDLSKINSGDIEITEWQFYNDLEEEKTYLKINLDAYPREKEEFSEFELDFYKTVDENDVPLSSEQIIYNKNNYIGTYIPDKAVNYRDLNVFEIPWNESLTKDGDTNISLEKSKLYAIKVKCKTNFNDNKITNLTHDVSNVNNKLNNINRWILTTNLFNDTYTNNSIPDFCNPGDDKKSEFDELMKVKPIIKVESYSSFNTIAKNIEGLLYSKDETDTIYAYRLYERNDIIKCIPEITMDYDKYPSFLSFTKNKSTTRRRTKTQQTATPSEVENAIDGGGGSNTINTKFLTTIKFTQGEVQENDNKISIEFSVKTSQNGKVHLYSNGILTDAEIDTTENTPESINITYEIPSSGEITGYVGGTFTPNNSVKYKSSSGSYNYKITVPTNSETDGQLQNIVIEEDEEEFIYGVEIDYKQDEVYNEVYNQLYGNLESVEEDFKKEIKIECLSDDNDSTIKIKTTFGDFIKPKNKFLKNIRVKKLTSFWELQKNNLNHYIKLYPWATNAGNHDRMGIIYTTGDIIYDGSDNPVFRIPYAPARGLDVLVSYKDGTDGYVEIDINGEQLQLFFDKCAAESADKAFLLGLSIGMCTSSSGNSNSTNYNNYTFGNRNSEIYSGSSRNSGYEGLYITPLVMFRNSLDGDKWVFFDLCSLCTTYSANGSSDSTRRSEILNFSEMENSDKEQWVQDIDGIVWNNRQINTNKDYDKVKEISEGIINNYYFPNLIKALDNIYVYVKDGAISNYETELYYISLDDSNYYTDEYTETFDKITLKITPKTGVYRKLENNRIEKFIEFNDYNDNCEYDKGLIFYEKNYPITVSSKGFTYDDFNFENKIFMFLKEIEGLDLPYKEIIYNNGDYDLYKAFYLGKTDGEHKLKLLDSIIIKGNDINNIQTASEDDGGFTRVRATYHNGTYYHGSTLEFRASQENKRIYTPIVPDEVYKVYTELYGQQLS